MRTDEEIELVPKVAAARRRLQQAYNMMESTWGVDGITSLTLEARMDLGRNHLERFPHDAEAKRLLTALGRALERARADPQDRVKCHRYNLASQEYKRANADYLRQRQLAREPEQMTLV